MSRSPSDSARSAAGLALAALLLLAADSRGEPRALDAAGRVSVAEAELYLEIRGADASAPVLVWLHGGPGGAERPLFRWFNGELESRFVVVYLDQRGTGRSFDAAADPNALTIARHLADLDAVIEHLRRTLGCDRVALAGHSWGGALGLLYAHAHPERVSALAAVAPLVNTLAAQETQFAFVSAEAERRGDDAALAELREIGAPPHRDSRKALAVERIAERYGAVFHREPSRTWVVLGGMARGLVTPWEIPRLIRGNDVSLAAMHDELLALDLAKSVPSLDVPVLFALGRFDRHVSADVAARWFESLRAPAKRLVWFEESAHNPPFEEPERFDATWVAELRALGVPAR